MIKSLKNGILSIKVSSLGAEMQELLDSNGVNRLHDGNPKYWARKSPVLFPIISRFVDQKYTYNNKQYNMGLHGFARNMEFIEHSQSENSLTYLLKDTKETYESYPFNFELYVTYTLIENKVKVTYTIKNVGPNKMYFMIGGHPAFKVPLFENENYDDYYVEFEHYETVEKTKLNGNYLSAETEPFLNNQKVINLRYKMFDPDAFVMEGLKSKYIDLKSYKNDTTLRFYFDEFKKFAIWSQLSVDAPFVCFEPWNGISKKYVDPIEEKGVLELESNNTFECSYTIEIVK